MELLCGAPGSRRTRGPKPGLTVERIVRAAIEVADAEGLAALSMRRVADQLGVGTMSLYTYVPGKAELIDVMLDAVHAEPEAARARRRVGGGRNWRRPPGRTGSATTATRGCSTSRRRTGRRWGRT
jgi:AcrR family transcriptional regulator